MSYQEIDSFINILIELCKSDPDRMVEYFSPKDCKKNNYNVTIQKLNSWLTKKDSIPDDMVRLQLFKNNSDNSKICPFPDYITKKTLPKFISTLEFIGKNLTDQCGIADLDCLVNSIWKVINPSNITQKNHCPNKFEHCMEGLVIRSDIIKSRLKSNFPDNPELQEILDSISHRLHVTLAYDRPEDTKSFQSKN